MKTSLNALASRTFDEEILPVQSSGIAHLLLRAARMYPRSGVWMDSAERGINVAPLTYPALLEEAQHILGALQNLGRPAGTVIALLLERPHDFIPSFWACVLGGYVPCMLTPIRNDPQRWAAHLKHIDTLLEHPLLITTGELKHELPKNAAAVELDKLRDGPPQKNSYTAAPEDPAMLVLTSGSTDNAKAVVLTHSNVLASLKGKAERQHLSAADVTFNWISFDHIAALSEMHLLPLYVGAMQLQANPAAILADPLLFLRLIDRYRVSVTFTPNFLLGQINAALQSGPRPPLDLSCVRRIICGGEAIVVETARRFLALLESSQLAPDTLWPAFGMTETCAGCTYSREFAKSGLDGEFATLGQPIDAMQLRIVDESGEPVRDGEPGSLLLRGPMVFGRYYNNKDATRAVFTPDGWFRSGDLGRIENGRLSLVGRSKDSIIINGVNYFSHELETALHSIEGIEHSFVAAFPTRPKGADTEQLVVAFATPIPLDDEARVYQLIAAIRNTTILLWGFRPAAILPLPKACFQKTSLGKIQRTMLRKKLEAGEFAARQADIAAVIDRQLGGYAPPEGAAETTIAAIYAEIFGMDPQTLSVNASFFDLGGTSLDIIRLKQQLHQRLGFTDISMMTILQHPTVREVARYASPEGRALRNAYDPLVPLQVTGSKTPLFCVHPGVGDVLVFVNLAKYFVNDRPFYALRARGFNEGDEYFSSFAEMVTTYVTAIRKQQPRGPYALAGYSYGAPVAFEIAKALEAQGERVSFIGSIDMPPFILQPLGEVRAVESAVILAFFLSLIQDKRQLLELPGQLRETLPAHDHCRYLLALAAPERLAQLDLDVDKFSAWAALVQALVDIGRSYLPSGTVESVSVFCAEPFFGTRQDWMNNELRRWDEFARGQNRYIDVAGEHHTLMDPNHVGKFQAILREEIDRAMNGC